MRREDLGDLMAFATIAQERSFTRAAVKLELSSSALSHAVRLLEDRLGAKLLNRTTRSVAPTAAGERLLARLRPALAEIGEGLDTLAEDRDLPCGQVRINTHRSAAALHVIPKLMTLRSRFPDVTLDLSIDDGLVDIVSAGYDAGIRHGERIAQDMIAVRISAASAATVVASPAYLAGTPAPLTPSDLVRHDTVAYRLPTSGAMLRWEFLDGARKIDVDVTPVFVSNDMDVIIEAAVAGAGVAYLLRERAASRIASGELVELLPEWAIPHEPCYLYYPNRRHIRPAMRAVIDVLRQET